MPRKRIGTTQIQQDEHGVAAVAEPPVKPKKSSRKTRTPKAQPDPAEVDSNQHEVVNSATVSESTPAVISAERVEPQSASGERHAETPAIPATPADAQPSEQTPPETNPETERPRFRSWSFRNASGYEKLTDTKRGLLVLKFRDRPSQEILDAVKDGGFQYHPNYEDQGKVWLRRNDFEGRIQVEKIEMMLRETSVHLGAKR